ncbi:GNAT family N-acetyltransferase [Gallibacter intestinalis]|uniref:GNAT family N-acetyltransferase n=1 Tax=Gallibacter intestinalis TaxID=2779356 RepID=A0ABR9QV47_9FIRM|nr:GNAT family N-acetyltransferase [Gallibacter intestinalis]MBE5034740.1 GNAT family N-acetyltransferase [Gallibacter intestinalis]
MNSLYINSIFESKGWLTSMCGDNWEIITVKKNNGEIAAALPIYYTKKFGCKLATVPPLSQTCGLYIERTGAKLSKQLEKEKKYIVEIIDRLPKNYSYDLYLDANNEYVLPFLWKGFKVVPRFSYRIEKLDDLDVVWAGFKENIRTDIRKAEKKVKVVESENIDILIKMLNETFKRQNRKSPYDENIIKKLDTFLKKEKACKLLYAIDDDENIHAATYFVYDEKRCYYLMSGGDPLYRNSGATALLVWEGIKFASKHSELFDFEGSMIEDIERFVRGFGAKPQVYYNVRKLKPLLRMAEGIKPTIKKLLHYK